MLILAQGTKNEPVSRHHTVAPDQDEVGFALDDPLLRPLGQVDDGCAQRTDK